MIIIKNYIHLLYSKNTHSYIFLFLRSELTRRFCMLFYSRIIPFLEGTLDCSGKFRDLFTRMILSFRALKYSSSLNRVPSSTVYMYFERVSTLVLTRNMTSFLGFFILSIFYKINKCIFIRNKIDS